MKSRSLYAAALIALACLGVALGYLMRAQPVPPISAAARPMPMRRNAAPPVVADPLRSAPSAIPAGSPMLGAIERLCDLLERHAARAGDLGALKAALLAADPAEAIAAIRRFLRTGRDAATGQEFTIAAGGTLSGAPTLRLMLLDVLGQIARKSRSDAASAVAREILADKSSADEWALALRNVAWTEPQPRTFLADKMREMLRYEPWRAAPSAGMLEALDVVVFTKDASLVPDLDQARAAGNELAHAADIALDRLAEAAPLNVLTFLNTHPAQLNDRPFLRADYFAKADLSDGAQRAQIEIYLGRPDISLAEKSKLLRALTALASFVGDSLLTA
ncbi:MAG TPA: hypothetical protein VEO95_13780, partial [Chthoniobacteraceae bacterium]|nr:hypothetical protein [Chthoniobacteraceae bacterium]